MTHGINHFVKQDMNKRISLVIGLGGSKYAAAIDLWRVLQEEDLQVDSVVTCKRKPARKSWLVFSYMDAPGRNRTYIRALGVLCSVH